MSYTVEKLISSPEEVLKKLPLKEELKSKVVSDRQAIMDIIEGKDKRKLLIIGPCTAWPERAVVEYAKELKKIADEVSDKIKIVMRVYTQKPRTTIGWTGPVNQPDPYKVQDIEKGIYYCRQMMLEILEIGLPIADEALFTHNDGYFTDLLSWVAIGARSAEDQEHRIYASMINHPVGLKNPTSGDLKKAINSVIASQNSHVFLHSGRQVRTQGNSHAHVVLRGGNGSSNIDFDSLKKTSELLKENNVKNPSIVIDCSHENSIDSQSKQKDPLKQPEILTNVVESMKKDSNLMNDIKGFMSESFIKTGNQKLTDAQSQFGLDLNGLSVVDPCIGIEETEKMIKDLHENL